ncbi:MAG: PQQ-dependent sugar dehydrogenase [Phycisphaerales bacterium]|nr:PQQ-dependent sugar dehydrogenase [Phycisphaerales bacterium]
MQRMTSAKMKAALAGAMVFAATGAAMAQPGDYANYADVVSGLGDALYAAYPPGEPNRLIIVQRNGIIRVVDNGVLQANAFLSLGSTTAGTTVAQNRITPTGGTVRIDTNGNVVASGGTVYTVSRANEQGLLGLAFDPDYATNRRFYVYYTAPRGNWQVTSATTATDRSQTVVARYTTSANPNIANTAEERILTFNQPFWNHNGGCMQIGSDGLLYITTGDGGSGNDPNNAALDLRSTISGSANVDSWMGKILRIDIRTTTGYTVPASNPFVGQSQLGDPCRPEVYCYGLRNPWRFSFDRLTNDLWIADVGQDLWEEINFAPSPTRGAGFNWGWRAREGSVNTANSASPFSNANAVDPVYVYPHSTTQAGGGAYLSTQTGISVTGGYVYRGSAIPGWRGRYFFADFGTARIWSFRYINGQRVDFQDHTSQLTGPSGTISQIASFGETPTGELLIVQLNGRVRQIVPQTLANTSQFVASDIAQDTGDPGTNGVVNEGDYNLFFNSFFLENYVESWPADIANSAGDVSPQYATGVVGGGPNGVIDEGDYNAFFNNFFLF